MSEPTMRKYNTMKEFFPFYLTEHSNGINRMLHFVGTTLGLVLLGCTIYFQNLWFLPAALVSGYAFAWVGHFFFEKNRPATFTYPFKSFAGDWMMWFLVLTGQINRKMAEAQAAMAKRPG